MTAADRRTARTVLIAGSLVLAVSFGVRHSFGLFLDPISSAQGWGRDTFGFAIAVQNLVWGAGQPFAGWLADRWGAARVVAGGALLYAGGLALMAQPLGGPHFLIAAGLLVGLGLSGTTFPVVFGAIARTLPAKQRNLAFGIAMAVGSFGQFVMLPLALGLIEGIGWAAALLALSGLAAVMLPLGLLLARRPGRPGRSRAGPVAAPVPAPGDTLTATMALRGALASRDFLLLAFGFFVCGFQLVFIGTYLPAFLADRGLPVALATTVLALVGLVNIAGTLAAGWLGNRWRKPALLAWVYLGRSAAIALFVVMPVSTSSAWLFGVLMGLFWLSTVPLTNGTVVGMVGVRNFSMIGGLVFFAHQFGGFLGGVMGAVLFEWFGGYEVAWALAIALGIVAALANLPVRERAIAPAVAAA